MSSKRQAKAMQSQYERLDRHIRTSMSVCELAHWDKVRAGSTLSRARDFALRKEFERRLRSLIANNRRAEGKR